MSVVVLTQTLALALALVLVRTLSSALVHQECHQRQDYSCVDHIHDDNHHRDRKPHVRHYRCCHCLEGREREREHVTVSMRDIHQASDWLLGKPEYVSAH